MNLSLKVILRIVLPVALLAALAGLIQQRVEWSGSFEDAKQRLGSAAEASARMLDDELERIGSVTTALASLESAVDYLGWSRAGLGALAEDPRLDSESTLLRFASSHPEFESVELYDEVGERFAAVVNGRRVVAPRVVTAEAWFTAMMEGGRAAVWEGDSIRVSHCQVSSPEGQDPITICASVLVRPEAVAARALDFVHHALPGCIARVRVGGRVVHGMEASPEGESMTAEVGLSGVEGVLVLEQEIALALAETHAAQRSLVGLLIVLLIAIPVTTWWSLRHTVLSPVRRLSQMVSAFERKEELPVEESVLVGAEGRAGDELESLAASFRRSVEESRRSERSLQELTLSLEKRVLERTRELERSNHSLAEATEAATSATRAKSEFLANMSHEIRTPMTAILGFAELLLDATASPSDRLEASQVIRRNGQHLLLLINDILDLSKIEAGKLDVEMTDVDLLALLRDLRSSYAERARERGNRFSVQIGGEIPERIVSDPVRLKQALVNLVGNALKFTENGSVSVRVTCEPTAETLSFEVVDTGLGMSATQRKGLFRPFTQAEASTTRRFGGTGLGLSITKHLAGLLGGQIECESELGKGSLFRLRVATGSLTRVAWATKLGQEEGRPEAKDPVPVVDVGARVLLVEDGRDNQRLIGLILKRMGASVEVAENGQIGLEMAEHAWNSDRPFDLLLMDMQMPVMDGYTATSELRQRGYPGWIVALTAHTMKGELERCIEAGCNAFLSKPISREDLAEAVVNSVRRIAPLVFVHAV